LAAANISGDSFNKETRETFLYLREGEGQPLKILQLIDKAYVKKM